MTKSLGAIFRNFKNKIKLKHFLALILIYLVLGLFQVPDIDAKSDYPLILGAHRGNSIEFTENTIPAIQNALETPKYQFIEIDIQYTKDKQIVVFHDKSLMRMQNKLLNIYKLSFQELQAISNYPIPLYETVMDLIDDQKRVNIEIKSQGNFEDDKKIVDFVIKDCQKRGILDKILLSSISTEVVKYISQTYPALQTGKIYLIHPITYLPFEFIVKDFYQEMSKIGADYIMLHGINLKNYNLLTELKPEEQTLVFWYFNDEMLVMQKDPTDVLW